MFNVILTVKMFHFQLKKKKKIIAGFLMGRFLSLISSDTPNGSIRIDIELGPRKLQ